MSLSCLKLLEMLIDARFFIFIEATICAVSSFSLFCAACVHKTHNALLSIRLFKPVCFAILLVPNMLNVQESYELEEVKILLCKSVSC